jgi:hypothetical protein
VPCSFLTGALRHHRAVHRRIGLRPTRQAGCAPARDNCSATRLPARIMVGTDDRCTYNVLRPERLLAELV